MPDNTALTNFIQLSQQSLTQGYGSNTIEKILYGGDQNLACQLIGSLSQTLNSMDASTQAAAAAG